MTDVWNRTRLPAKIADQLERLAEVDGVSVYELSRQALLQFVQARLGTLSERARLNSEIVGLEEQEAAAIKELVARHRERAVKRQERAEAEAKEYRFVTGHPADRVVALLNSGRIEAALDVLSQRGGNTTRQVVLNHVRAQLNLPGADEFLARAQETVDKGKIG